MIKMKLEFLEYDQRNLTTTVGNLSPITYSHF